MYTRPCLTCSINLLAYETWWHEPKMSRAFHSWNICRNSTCFTETSVANTSYIHVFSLCVQLDANNLLTLSPLCVCVFFFNLHPSISSFLLFLFLQLSFAAFLTRWGLAQKAVRICSAVSEMPSGSALDIGLGVSLTRNKPIKESPGTA